MGDMWTIYCHTHVDSGRCYVGLTKTTMLQRWNRHVYSASRSKGRSHFANAIKKYGKDAFSHRVLEVCETLEAANAAEKRLIEELGTRDPLKGFNLMEGGGSQPHPIRKNPWNDSEYREKCTEATRTRMASVPKILLSVTSKEVHSRPSVKKKLSTASLDMWSRPDYRKKQELLADSKRALPGLSIGADKLRSRTHCKNGHELSSENVRIHVRKGTVHQIRVCLTCQRDRHVRSVDNMTEDHVEARRIQMRDRMRRKRASPSLDS